MKFGITVYVILAIIAVSGWIQSIVKFAHCDFKPPYKAEIVYGLGMVIPAAGIFVGWINIGK